MTSQLHRARLATGTLFRAAPPILAALGAAVLLMVAGAGAVPALAGTLSTNRPEQAAPHADHLASSASVPAAHRSHGAHCPPGSELGACGLLHCTTLAAPTPAVAPLGTPVLRGTVSGLAARAVLRHLPQPEFPPPRA